MTYQFEGTILVVTERHEVEENFARFVQAMAAVKRGSVNEVLDTWFDDPECRSVAEVLADKMSVYEMASHVMGALVAPVGEFALADTAEEYAEQVEFWHDPGHDEAFEEFKIAAACALTLDGEGARRHFQKAAELAAW